MRAIILNGQFLCEETQVCLKDVLPDLVEVASQFVDIFVAAVDAFTDTGDTNTAFCAFDALQRQLSAFISEPDAVRCPAVLSHLAIQHGDTARAETMVRHALEDAQRAFRNLRWPDFHLDEMVDAAVRLLVVSAPFPKLW